MIARLSGVVQEKREDALIVDVHGVGYRVNMSFLALSRAPREGEPVKLRIQTVVRESTVPAIETGEGNCHVYLDATAPLQRSVEIVLNSKTHRVGVCNAAETLLVHKDRAGDVLPAVLTSRDGRGFHDVWAGTRIVRP